jgi:phosphoserine phosphatase RsbU/P
VRRVARDAAYFGTAVSATYNAATGELHCVRAGHPAPLLLRANGTVEAVGHAQPALGMFETPNYEMATVQLAPGDVALIFTDAATEVTNASDQDLNRAGLERLIREQLAGAPPAQLNLDNLEEQLLRYSGQIHLSDDLTILKLCRRQ